jgi:teichuronic acid biosynthesis glycosyltransferase TuaG
VSVSVVIPCYGGEGTLERALESVVKQSRPAGEILVVDDGNEEPGRSFLAALPARYEKLKIVRLARNSGPADARNAGWEAARERHVAFLDGDDAWHPRKLEWQLELMERSPRLSLTATDFFVSPAGPAVWPACDAPPASRGYSRLKALIINPSFTSSWMVRRELQHRFPRGGRYAEDFLFLLELLLDGEPVQHLDAELGCAFKPRLGRTTGLSSQLWKMERGELSVYASLRASGRLGFAAARTLQAVSLVKFARRLLLRVLWTPAGPRADNLRK